MKNAVNFYVIMAFALICLIITILTSVNHARIMALERRLDTTLEHLAIFEDATIETEANYDAVLNDLYETLHLHEEEIQRIGNQYEYHVNLEPWGYMVYDSEGRAIGAAPVEDSPLDMIFIKDNE